MSDPRHHQFASTLVNYSCALQPGEKVLIEAVDVPPAITTALVRAAAAAGAAPLVLLKSLPVTRELLLAATPEQLDLIVEGEAAVMRGVDAYIGLRGGDNVSELSDVPPEKMELYESKVWKSVHQEIRVPKTRWVVTRWRSEEHTSELQSR